MYCKKCGNQLNEGAKFCYQCGTPVSAAGKLFCQKCGGEVKIGASFCKRCGSPIAAGPTEQPQAAQPEGQEVPQDRQIEQQAAQQARQTAQKVQQAGNAVRQTARQMLPGDLVASAQPGEIDLGSLSQGAVGGKGGMSVGRIMAKLGAGFAGFLSLVFAIISGYGFVIFLCLAMLLFLLVRIITDAVKKNKNKTAKAMMGVLLCLALAGEGSVRAYAAPGWEEDWVDSAIDIFTDDINEVKEANAEMQQYLLPLNDTENYVYTGRCDGGYNASDSSYHIKMITGIKVMHGNVLWSVERLRTDFFVRGLPEGSYWHYGRDSLGYLLSHDDDVTWEHFIEVQKDSDRNIGNEKTIHEERLYFGDHPAYYSLALSSSNRKDGKMHVSLRIYVLLSDTIEQRPLFTVHYDDHVAPEEVDSVLDQIDAALQGTEVSETVVVGYDRGYFNRDTSLVIDSDASADAGEEDGGDFYPGTESDNHAAAGDTADGGSGSSGKGKHPLPIVPAVLLGGGGVILEETAREKKKKKLHLRLKLYKDFGDTLCRGGAARLVYARVVQVADNGTEIDRPDLTPRIQISSPDGILSVVDRGVNGMWKAAEVAAPKNGADGTDGIVSFRYADQQYSFTNRVHFNIEELQIKFYQENLTLPAGYDAIEKLPFTVTGLAAGFRVEASMQENSSYAVELQPTEDPTTFEACLRDMNANTEGEAGTFCSKVLTITATDGRDTVRGEIGICRFHTGLAVSFNAVNCFRVVKKELQGRDILSLNKDSDYEPAATKGHTSFFLFNEEQHKIVQLPAYPEIELVPDKDATETERDRIAHLGFTSVYLQEENPELAEGYASCAVYCKDGFIEAPCRFTALLKAKITYEDKVYCCEKEVLLRSQPLRAQMNPEQASQLGKSDAEISEQLDACLAQIWDMNWWEKLMPLYNMGWNLRQGYDFDYGYDPYTTARFFRIYSKILSGDLDFSGEASTVTTMDEIMLYGEELAKPMRQMDGLQGIILRIGLAWASGGTSELVLVPLDVNRGIMDYHKKTGGKGSPVGYFFAGAMPVVLNAAGGLAVKGTVKVGGMALKTELGQTAVRKLSSVIPKEVPEAAVAATKKIQEIMNPVRETVRKWDVELNMKTLRRLMGKETSQEAKVLGQSVKGMTLTAEQELRQLAAKAAKVDGEQAVKNLEAAWANRATDPKTYRSAILNVKKNPAAMETLRKMNGGKGNPMKADFNIQIRSIQEKAAEDAIDRLARERGWNRSQMKIRNVSGTELDEVLKGDKIPHDNDITIIYTDMHGQEIAVPLAVTKEHVYKATHLAYEGTEAASYKEALATSSMYGEHNCQPGDSEYIMGGASNYEKLKQTTEAFDETTAASISDTYQFKCTDPKVQGMAKQNRIFGGKSAAEVSELRDGLKKKLLDASKGQTVEFTETERLLIEADNDLVNASYTYKKMYDLFEPRDAEVRMMGYDSVIAEESRVMEGLCDQVVNGELTTLEFDLAMNKMNTSFGKVVDTTMKNFTSMNGTLGGSTRFMNGLSGFGQEFAAAEVSDMMSDALNGERT